MDNGITTDYKKYVFIAVMVTSFIGSFCSSSMNVALPTIGAEFSAGAGDLSRVVSAYVFGSATCMLPMGRVSDILGRRKIYTIGVTLFALTNILGGMSTSITMLQALRLSQGCILAMVFGTGMAILVSAHKPSERGKVIGSSAGAVYVGLSLGPVISGFICEALGWRFIFYIAGTIVLVSLWAILHVHEEWYGDKGAAFDYKGTICYMIAAPMLLYGISELASDPWGLKILFGGIALMAIFIAMQLKSASPMLDMHIFAGNPTFTLSNLASMIHYSSTFAISFLMSLYLQLCCSLSPSLAGLFILFQPIMMALLSPKAGALSDRINPGKVATVGMAINCAALFGMSHLTSTTPLYITAILLVIIGIGFALFSSPNNNAIMGAVQPKYYGTASSMLATMRTYGQAISMAIVTILMECYSVNAVAGSDRAGFLAAMSTGFLIFSGLCVIGLVLSIPRNR